MNNLITGLCLRADHWAQMEEDVISKAPEEACGLVGGIRNQAMIVIPITNELHSNVRFRMDPKEEVDAFISIEKQGWEVLAVYHSHPMGINQPSETDLEELSFPGIIYLIWYHQDKKWHCRGFLMQSSSEAGEVPVTIIDR